ncbi:calcium-responsive transcription factor [Esox lucius]|uniref:Calcium responsive transcription factor n=1 Tax=Esox lucius TaxID=8010 RepID=A0A3P8ZVT5_ESOLU|nr:calcium-responsive transcription factor [Esox lucius]
MEEQERTLTSQEDAEESTPGGLMTTEEEAKLLPNDPDITKTLQEPYGSTPEYIKAKPQSSEETLPQTQSQIETQSQTLTESNRLSQTEQQALSQTETQMLSQTETHTLTDTQTQSQIETQSQTLTESNRLSQTEQQTLSQTETHTLTDTQTLSQTQRQTEEFLILDQNGQSLHYEHMVIVSGQSDNGEMFVIPSTQLGGSHVLLPRGQLLDIMESSGSSGEKTGGDDQEEELQDNTLTTVSDDLTAVTSDAKTQTQSCQDCFTSPLKPLPSNAPNWALRLRNAEKIGDSYRGYCNTDTELETILWLHKQQTNSVFGTRQSPSPAKPATRLMWKSQYVPYDGIPFVNAGSRAIVMECEFGPRRKGLQPKKTAEQTIAHNIDYKATCPARIYIKKVRKFPQYRVPTDPKVDKKVVRQEQEKAFFNLRKTLWDVGGVLRYYMQLPTQKAHLYHDINTALLTPPPDLLPLMDEAVKQEEMEEEEEEKGCVDEGDGGVGEDGGNMSSRLHPRVADKIRELVEQGHNQVYQVRKQLRRFVEREMFTSEEVPERHNLCYFPTVNDIKNHIHEAQKTLQQNGVITDAHWSVVGGDPMMAETVTLTLTPASAEGSLQRVLEGSEMLSPVPVHLFSSLTSLQPKIFAQLQGIQLQPGLCSSEGAECPTTTLESMDLASPSPPGPLVVSPTLGEAMTLADPSALLSMGHVVSVSSLGDGQLVSVSSLEDGSLGTHHIVLEDGQTIPVQIVDHSVALTNPDEAKQDDIKQEGVTVQPQD